MMRCGNWNPAGSSAGHEAFGGGGGGAGADHFGGGGGGADHFGGGGGADHFGGGGGAVQVGGGGGGDHVLEHSAVVVEVLIQPDWQPGPLIWSQIGVQLGSPEMGFE